MPEILKPMTLNITLITQTGIHQSADFRLTELDEKTAGKYVPLNNHSAKILTLQYKAWGAFISYCGIGMWAGKHTYDYLAEWLCHHPGEDLSFEDVLKALEDNGNKWLDDITRSKRKRYS